MFTQDVGARITPLKMFVEVSVLASVFAEVGSLYKLWLVWSSSEAGVNLLPSLVMGE